MRAELGKITAGALPALALVVALAGAAPAPAQAPLSVIDWLQESLGPQIPDDPDAPTMPFDRPWPVTPRTGDAWIDDDITMRPIGTPRPEAVGLFPAERAGLPRDLWTGSQAEELAALMRGLPADALPALRALALALLLAEFDPPVLQHSASRPGAVNRQSIGLSLSEPAEMAPGPEAAPAEMDSEAGIAFVKARIDKLIEFGALDQAAALLDTLSPRDPALRARQFDVALLLGQENATCDDILHGEPPFPDAGARIFCLARAGRWPDAERLWQQSAEAGALDEAEAALLERFLDIDDLQHDEGETPAWLREELLQPHQISALSWRLLEAIGAPVASHGLPVAFAHADLRGTIGWRAQLEAAERLVRSGALPANRLLGLYSERSAAASGGIWERVRAIQRLEAALAQGAPDSIAAALARAWPQIAEGELEIAFAVLYAQQLLAAPLEGEGAQLAAMVGLLDTDPAPAAERLADGDARARFLAAIALGQPPLLPPGGASDMQITIAEALTETLPPLPDDKRALIEDGRAGEALLIMLMRMAGVPDPRALGEGLVLMRHLGLDGAARATALQALLLERHG